MQLALKESSISIKSKGLSLLPLAPSKSEQHHTAQIGEILSRRRITTLYHFTRLENLHSILTNGLIPVIDQRRLGMAAICNDVLRLDQYPNCSSFSVGFPNYKLFFYNRDRRFPGSQWVVLSLNAEILLDVSRDIYYCHTNAAAQMPRELDRSRLMAPSAFEEMFCNRNLNHCGNWVERRELDLLANQTTDPQAEILVSGIIAPKSIKTVSFLNDVQLEAYIKQFGNFDGQPSLLKVDPSVFRGRLDHQFW